MINNRLTETLIFKALRPAECAELVQAVEFKGSEVDLKDGFIHFSTYEQLPETLARHFRNEAPLWLAAVDSSTLGESLRWEISRGGDSFPHLHGALRPERIAWMIPLELGPDGRHLIPGPA